MCVVYTTSWRTSKKEMIAFKLARRTREIGSEDIEYRSQYMPFNREVSDEALAAIRSRTCAGITRWRLEELYRRLTEDRAFFEEQLGYDHQYIPQQYHHDNKGLGFMLYRDLAVPEHSSKRYSWLRIIIPANTKVRYGKESTTGCRTINARMIYVDAVIERP